MCKSGKLLVLTQPTQRNNLMSKIVFRNRYRYCNHKYSTPYIPYETHCTPLQVLRTQQKRCVQMALFNLCRHARKRVLVGFRTFYSSLWCDPRTHSHLHNHRKPNIASAVPYTEFWFQSPVSVRSTAADCSRHDSHLVTVARLLPTRPIQTVKQQIYSAHRKIAEKFNKNAIRIFSNRRFCFNI